MKKIFDPFSFFSFTFSRIVFVARFLPCVSPHFLQTYFFMSSLKQKSACSSIMYVCRKENKRLIYSNKLSFVFQTLRSLRISSYCLHKVAASWEGNRAFQIFYPCMPSSHQNMYFSSCCYLVTLHDLNKGKRQGSWKKQEMMMQQNITLNWWKGVVGQPLNECFRDKATRLCKQRIDKKDRMIRS